VNRLDWHSVCNWMPTEFDSPYRYGRQVTKSLKPRNARKTRRLWPKNWLSFWVLSSLVSGLWSLVFGFSLARRRIRISISRIGPNPPGDVTSGELAAWTLSWRSPDNSVEKWKLKMKIQWKLSAHLADAVSHWHWPEQSKR